MKLARTTPSLLWAPQAWVNGRWEPSVVMEVNAQGLWASITPNTAAPANAQVLSGPVLPGLVNAHSHAFQRAFAGLAERREGQHDDFWLWRDRMYGLASRITPQELEAIAAGLYRELLRGGYTQVCEFHYLHHQADGKPYADSLAMCKALVNAARTAGIGITVLPVVYERAGFTADALRPQQARFAATAQQVLTMRQGLLDWRHELQSAPPNERQGASANLNVGVAIHSLRAATPQSIAHLCQALEHSDGPIHIHVAEQTSEVKDCLAATGLRPIEWLTKNVPLDSRWHLVHATHASPQEIEAVAKSGASVVLCPTTEANLGDGLPDLPRWLAAGVPLSIGSDSHVGRNWPEELRSLEYGQRLALRQRNVAADPNRYAGSSAARLLELALPAGSHAAGFNTWGLQAGARADVLLLNTAHSSQAHANPEQRLDALVFTGPSEPFAAVMVAGQWADL